MVMTRSCFLVLATIVNIALGPYAPEEDPDIYTVIEDLENVDAAFGTNFMDNEVAELLTGTVEAAGVFYIANSYLAILSNDASDDDILALRDDLEGQGATTGFVYKNIFKGVSFETNEVSIISAIQSRLDVTQVFMDEVVFESASDDTLWSYERIGSETGEGRELKYDGKDVDIYVIDSGCDVDHTEFDTTGETRICANVWNHGDTQSDLSGKIDVRGHGTHVAGIATGKTLGVAPGANLKCVKVMRDDGSGSMTTILAGLEYVYEQCTTETSPPCIINMSLEARCDRSCPQSSLVYAADILKTGGIHVVSAAGNQNDNACNYVPAYASGITVGATGVDDKRASFSNYGSCLTLWAPGVDIYSACASAECYNSQSYKKLSGTSMATPAVAGVMAQCLSRFPALDPDDLEEVIKCLALQDAVSRAKRKSPRDLAQACNGEFELDELLESCA